MGAVSDGVTPGAVVAVTLAVGRYRWTNERCYVRYVQQRGTGPVAVVASIRRPAEVATVQINPRAVTVLFASVPAVDVPEVRGGA